LLHYWGTFWGYVGVSTLQGISWSIILLGGGRSEEADRCLGGFGQNEA